jgi:hypothetical protein
MAFKVKVVALTTSDTLISQMAANAEGAIHGLVLCNNNDEARTVTLKLYDASTGITSNIISGVSIAAKSQFTWPKPINLEANDILYGVGADIVALHSTYVGTATPAAIGFTGQGAWSSSTTYDPNDVVSYNGNSYLANATNTNSAPPSANWTLLAAKGETGSLPAGEIRTPTAISPLSGGDNLPPNGPLVASPYAPLYSADTRNYREFQVATNADTTFASPVFSVQVNADTTLISPVLAVTTAYRWRCRDVANNGAVSDWMTVQTFTTKNLSVVTPTVTVEGAPASVTRSPLITTSAYATTPDASATHLSTSWEVRKQSDNSLVWSSYNDTVNLLSIQVPYDVLTVSTAYFFRAKHISSLYGESAYGSASGTTTFTFPNVVYSPAIISNENLYLTTSGKSASRITDNKFIVAYAERPSALTVATFSATLKLSIWDRTSGVFVENAASIVNAATDMAAETDCYDVEMITSTLGVVTWRTYFEGTGTGFIYSRAFNIVGGTSISFGVTTTMDTATSSTRQRIPKITRLADDLAVLTYFGGASAVTPFARGIKFINTSMTVSAAVSVGTASSSASGISYQEIKRLDDNKFISANFYYDGSTTYYSALAVGAINSSTAVVTAGASINSFASSTLTNGRTKIAVLSPTLALVGYTTNTGNFFTQLDINTTTYVITVGTGGRAITSTVAWTDVGYDFTPLSSTTALAFYETTGRIITASPTLTSEGVSQILQPQTSTNTTLVPISESSGTLRFEQWSQNDPNMFNTQVSVFSGAIGSQPIAVLQSKPFATQYTSLNRNDSTVTMSVSRAAIMERDSGYASSANSGQVALSMWNISTNTPTRLTRTLTNISATTSETQSALCAISSSRLLVAIENNLYLFSAADNGFTQLSTVALSGVSGSTSYSTSVIRISATEALIFYRNTSGGVSCAPANLTGDTITLGSLVGITASTAVISIRAVALSATRALVVFSDSTLLRYRATLIGFNGTTWNAVQSDFTISGALTGTPTGPGSISALDSSRAVVAYQSSTTTGEIVTVNTTGDVLAGSGSRATPTLVTNSTLQSVFAVALDTVNCILGVQETAGTGLYAFTVGAGTAIPSTLTKVADLNTNATQSNPALRGLPVAAIGTGIQPTAQVLVQERDAGTNQSHNVLLRKFLRGTV